MTDRRLSVWLVCLLCAYSCRVHAQQRYWIEFRDKGIAEKNFVPGNPVFEAAYKSLSRECLLRRAAAMGKNPLATITMEDAPLCSRYLDSLCAIGVTPLISYKWGNAVSAELTVSQVRQLRTQSFIRRIYPVGHAELLSTQPIAPSHRTVLAANRPLTFSNFGCGYDPIIYAYGGSQSQLDRINVWPLHAMGFDGSGVRLGLLDAGSDVAVSSLDNANVLFQYDYVFQDSNVANPEDEHGTETLSTAMGYLPDTLIGPAYHCSVMIAHTEDTRSERNIEEDNYAAALEDMEARGVEITSSSLGYFTFDSGQHSYTYADMNGHTAICTQAVERAAKLGVLVVTAMGNNGADTVYPHVQAPADADSILACGALDVNDLIAGFSSLGPTYDGRIKPDICAPGVSVWAQGPLGNFGSLDGTSFATPLTSGACCLIKQAHPEATAQQIRRAVIATGSNAAHPDTVYGWGKLNAYAAALELGPVEHLMNLSADSVLHVCVGAAAKFGVYAISFEYHFSADTTPLTTSLHLVADSLIYSGVVPSIPSGGLLYYRIALRDGSGATTDFPSSGWDEFDLPARQLLVSVYPNPSNSVVTLNANEPGQWVLFDQTGKPMVSGKLSTLDTANAVFTGSLSSGVYYFKFSSQSGETKVLPIAVEH
jgi:serine protease AprX